MPLYTFYKIVCEDESSDYIYVGSTENFTRRKGNHKTHCNNVNDKAYNIKVYKTIRENGGWENWRMVPIEKKECEDKINARIHEDELLNELKLNKIALNSIRPYISEEQRKEQQQKQGAEYYEKNKEQILEQQKEYIKQNKDRRAEYKKQKVNCPHCGKEMNKSSLTRHIKSQHS